MPNSSPRIVRSETDFKAFEVEDAYNRKKLLLDVMTWVGVLVLLGAALLLTIQVAINPAIRAQVTGIIVSNIPGIVYTGLIIFGLRPNK